MRKDFEDMAWLHWFVLHVAAAVTAGLILHWLGKKTMALPVPSDPNPVNEAPTY